MVFKTRRKHMKHPTWFSGVTRFALSAAVGALLIVNTAAGAVFSSQFTVFGDVTSPRTFNYAQLSALPSTIQMTQTVTYLAGGSSVTTTFTGVNLWALLNDVVGVTTDPGVKNPLLRKYVVATGSDGYEAAFSFGELSPDFGHQPDFIAYNQNGVPITTDGFARVVVPGDTRGGRYVSNLVSLWVGDVGTVPAVPVPEPGALVLLIGGLVGMAWWRRARSH
jgi:DMSO/TMAO reductase YedYZ molybdopterin-dependent catalytic subunit